MKTKILKEDISKSLFMKFYVSCITIGFGTFFIICIPLFNRGYLVSTFLGFLIYYSLVVMSLSRYYFYENWRIE